MYIYSVFRRMFPQAVKSTFLVKLLCMSCIGLALSSCGNHADSSHGSSATSASVNTTTSDAELSKFKDISLQSQAQRVIVLMYHDVIARRNRDSTYFDCTSAEFEEQMNFIADNGGSVITIDELYKHLTDGTPVPLRSVVLTFDDDYQGVKDFAAPVLARHKFPATLFVHTGFVGNTTQGRPKMSWDTLRELQKTGLYTIADHTITHPDDITKLSPDEQKKELGESKEKIEKELGIKVTFLAYPVGHNDETTRQIAQDLGYTMAMTMKSQPAEASPDILQVGRYIQTKLQKAWDDREKEIACDAPGFVEMDLRAPAVTCETGTFAGMRLALVKGGKPVSNLADGRKSVSDFVTDLHGIAGVNGTFFSMAAIKSDDNGLVGPSMPEGRSFAPDGEQDRLIKLVNRPMVLWNDKKMTFVSFSPENMNRELPFRAYMPDMTDAFLAGAWIVHDGKPRSYEQMRPYASQDIQDFRRRVFFGLMADGSIITGASRGSVTTEQLAVAVAEAGAKEAVLLDSGFSTSLVYDGKILASGHSTPETPSRPVPHAIVLLGEKGTTVVPDIKPTEDERPRKRRTRRRRSTTDAAPSTAPTDTAPPAAGPPAPPASTEPPTKTSPPPP